MLSFYVFEYVIVPALAIAYVAGGVWLLRAAVRGAKSGRGRFVSILGIGAVLALIPFGDVIWGRAYHWRLCESEAEERIYRVVELEEQFFNKWGGPDFRLVPGESHYELAGRYATESHREVVLSWPKIDRVVTVVRDKTKGDSLGQVTYFAYWGGWLANNAWPHVNAERCANTPKAMPGDLQDKLFMRTKVSNPTESAGKTAYQQGR